MRVIIVDDEPLARAVLREHLGAHADVAVVAECANGFEAIQAIAERAPDVVFLDIQMPQLDGFEVVELAGTGPGHPHYVFVTAYDRFALRAFEVHALDYLLKPFGAERLAQALAHVRTRLSAAAPAAGPADAGPAPREEAALQAAVGAAQARRQPLARVLIRNGARVQVVPVERIDHVEAQDDYVAILADGRRWLKNQRLAELESQLDPRAFLRVHRSYIVNLAAVVRIEPAGKDGHCAVMASGSRVPISRSGYPRIRDLLR